MHYDFLQALVCLYLRDNQIEEEMKGEII